MPEIHTKVLYKKTSDNQVTVKIILFPNNLALIWLRIKSICALENLATARIFRGALVITCNQRFKDYSECETILDKLLQGTKNKYCGIVDVTEIKDRTRENKNKTDKVQSITPRDKRIISMRLNRELIFSSNNPVFPSLDSPSTTTNETSPRQDIMPAEMPEITLIPARSTRSYKSILN